jgi:two-component sensor histidine kinase
MLQQLSLRQAEALAHAADSDETAKEVNDPKPRSDHRRMAHSWRLLSRSYDFQHALERFFSFEKSGKVAERTVGSDALPPLPPIQAVPRKKEADFLDRLARRTERVRPFSATALGIAVAAVAAATLLRWLSGSTPVDLRFGVYIVAIMASGLLAGLPAAIGTAAASLLIVLYAFVPPYFALEWPSAGGDQINFAMASFAALVTVYFTHCCRVVLRRLSQRELANQVLVNELEHRGRNIFSINQVIVRKSLADDPQRAEKIIGRFRAVQNANDLLTRTTACPMTLRELLSIEFAPYDSKRLVAEGPEVEVAPEAARHFLLIFHELATNAAKYGALSSSEGRIRVQWQWAGGEHVVLTWTESGGPGVLLPTRKGFGSQLIEICVKALNGTVERSFSQNGFSCKIATGIRA